MGDLKFFNLADIIRRYDTQAFVESGTGWGNGVRHAATFPFQLIVSIDIVPDAVLRLRRTFESSPQVYLVAGNSVDVFREVLPQIRTPICFWLDAHFPGADLQIAKYDAEKDPDVRLPLEREMRTIRELRPEGRDVILIDDRRIYERDAYDWGNLDEKGDGHLACYGGGFLDRIFQDTHTPERFTQQTGYLALWPKEGRTLAQPLQSAP